MYPRIDSLITQFTSAAAFALAVTTSHAATFTVDNEADFRDALASAFGNGQNTLDTIIIEGSIDSNSQFDLQSKVTIKGKDDCFRCSQLIRTSSNINTPLLNVQYPDIQISNLLLINSGQNINTQIAATAGDDTSNSALINIPALSYSNNNPTGIKILNNTFEDSAIGVASTGLLPKDLTIQNNDFNDVNRAVELLRDLAIVSDIDSITDAQALDGGKLVINFNRHRGNRIRLGISVDAGNDGLPYKASSFPDIRQDVRRKFRDRPTVYDTDSTININTITGANEFGIAVATVRNMNIAGNTITTAEDDITSPDFINEEGHIVRVEDNFTAGINVEHNSFFVNVDNNTITVGTTGNFATGINVLPFQDHGAPLNHRNASKFVTIRGNTIRGTGRQAVLGFGYESLQLINNNADDFTTTQADNSTVSLFNVPDGVSSSTTSGNNVDFVFFNGFSGTGVAPRSFDASGSVVP